jgi:hypothetical protein
VSQGLLYSNVSHLTAYDLSNGKIVWLAKDIQTSDTHVLYSSVKYIFAYKVIDDYSVLTAVDRETGRIGFEAFSKINDTLNDPPTTFKGQIAFAEACQMKYNSYCLMRE